MSKTNLTIAVSDTKVFKKKVAEIEKAGFSVDSILESLDIVTGSIASENVGKLRKIEGITFEDQNNDIGIAPPESDIQ